VKGERLAEIAKSLNLQNQIILGAGELKSGGWRRKSVLANTLEAIIGAIYLDSDLNTCSDIIYSLYQTYLEEIDLSSIKKDAKTELQEYLQARQINVPRYINIKKSGTSHEPLFRVECHVDSLSEPVLAEGGSKRKAEQAAAKLAYDKLISEMNNKK